MDESNETVPAVNPQAHTGPDDEPETDVVTLRVKPWVPFVILALAWPVAAQVFLGAFILADALTQGAGVPFSGEVFALAGVLVGGLAAWWLGRGVTRAGGVQLLWIVPAIVGTRPERRHPSAHADVGKLAHRRHALVRGIRLLVGYHSRGPSSQRGRRIQNLSAEHSYLVAPRLLITV